MIEWPWAENAIDYIRPSASLNREESITRALSYRGEKYDVIMKRESSLEKSHGLLCLENYILISIIKNQLVSYFYKNEWQSILDVMWSIIIFFHMQTNWLRKERMFIVTSISELLWNKSYINNKHKHYWLRCVCVCMCVFVCVCFREI